MKFYLSELLARVFAVSVVDAQTQLSGKIQDLNTGQPIDYATIAVFEAASNKVLDGATADSAGNFSIRGLPTSTYKVTVSYLGYDTYL